jgi:ribonuclease J
MAISNRNAVSPSSPSFTRGIPLDHAHTSGHASIPDLKRLAEAIQPKMLVPIHTYEPGQFPAHFQAVSLKNDGEWWDGAT